MAGSFKNIEAYIKTFPQNIQDILIQLAAVIKKNAPGASESISYGMPAFKIYGKPLIYFAAFKNHIGLYATPTGHKEFTADLFQYKQGKGSVQFPLNQPIPLDLVAKIVQFRVKENAGKAK